MAEAAEYPIDLRVADRQALEAFVVENADLETLEGLLEQFNIFEALGVRRQELRHSDFLAFLLDPRQNHRLGDAFVQRMLQKILIAARDLAPPLSPVHLDSWDLGRLTIHREWRNIDILLVDQANRLVVVIENKIDSTEHSGQLARYLGLVGAEYPAPEWRHLAVYLTPDGEAPSVTDYLPADYGLVADAVEAVAESRRPALDLAVHELMIHYSRMLRRHIVTDSEIADLCRRIYHRHQRALDLIFEHRPDRLAEVQAILLDLVRSRDDLVLDTASKQIVRFAPVAWEGLPRGEGWTRSGRLVLFEFDSYPDRLDLSLYVGPGPVEARRRLIELATAQQPPFRVPKRGASTNQKWKSIFSRRFLRLDDYQDASHEGIEALIRARWEEFVDRDLPALVAPIHVAARSIATSLADGEATSATTTVLAHEAVSD
ncbi:MAG: PD-(D/E)XK nuclease family protein [Chloroflexota bacterium]|nr:PD-(D/E)XK nuclease family protein [Chloroflexota bacterium]